MDDELKAIRAERYKRAMEISGPVVKRQRTEFAVLTWNVDGLDCERPPEDIALRSVAVCEVIINHLPVAVLLQEVIDVTLNLFIKALGSQYHFHKQDTPSQPYFVVILTLKSELRPLSVETVTFANSSMGRAMLGVKVELIFKPGQYLYFATAHLESGRETSAERKVQLREASEICATIGWPSVFGGDMNLRDYEVKDNLNKMMIDVWENCGKENDTEYTWDTLLNDNVCLEGKKPRFRFDRLYTRQLAPSSFQLVGKDRISEIGRFPSDHFGILASFRFTCQLFILSILVNVDCAKRL